MIYPVPAVKGGAVEGLIEILMKKNEIYKSLDLTVISAYDVEAERAAANYSSSRVLFLKNNDIWNRIWSSKIFLYANRINIKFKGEHIFNLPITKKIWKLIRKEPFDVYILEGGGDYYNFGYIHKKIPRDKLWVHFHGEMQGDLALKKWFSKYIVVSNYIGRKLICNGIINQKEVKVLHNCFDADAMRCDISEAKKENVRKRFGLTENDFVFVYWGRLLPQKGVLEAIKAFSKLAKKHEMVKLLIVGNATFGYGSQSSYDNDLREASLQDDVKDKIIFTGFVNHDEIGEVLHACDVGLIPSIWDEPAALTVFEALATGLPTVTTNVGGTPEVIRDGYNGILLNWSTYFVDDLEKKMKYLFESRETRETISRNCYETIRNYTDDIFYEEFVEILNNGT